MLPWQLCIQILVETEIGAVGIIWLLQLKHLIGSCDYVTWWWWGGGMDFLHMYVISTSTSVALLIAVNYIHTYEPEELCCICNNDYTHNVRALKH